MTDPARLRARVAKEIRTGPYGLADSADGFTLVAEVLGPPRARGRRHRERLTHVVVLDGAAGTYRVTDRRETVGEAEPGESVLRLRRREDVPLDPAVEVHRILAGAAAELGWQPARTGPTPRAVLAVVAAVCVVALVVAVLLVFSRA